MAVCPDCGAPYHRACIVKTGVCVFLDLHAQKKSWQNPNRPTEPSEAQHGNTDATRLSEDADHAVDHDAEPFADTGRRCDQCGLKNPKNGLFCEVCGNALTQQRSSSSSSHAVPGATISPNSDAVPTTKIGWQSFSAEHPNPLFSAPLGGLDPEETIAEIPVKDLAIFTGQNASYFLPKFKSYTNKEQNASFFNFSAALFHSFYCFYRKMYLIGFIVFLATTILSIPAMLLTIDQMRTQFIGPTATPWFHSEGMRTLIQACWTVTLLLRFALGLLFNRLYLRHTIAKVKQIQKKERPQEEYVEALTKAGSVSMRVIFLTIGLLIVAGYAIAIVVLL